MHINSTSQIKEYNCMKTVFILDFLLISHFEHMVLLFS